MASTTTAQVQVHHAEVHVLQVGSRQVTLSVARQLDVVNPRQMTPFGRVKLDKTTTDGIITTIGRHNVTGALVLATFLDFAKFPDAHEKGCLALEPVEKYGIKYTVVNDVLCRCDAVRNWCDATELPLIVLAGLK